MSLINLVEPGGRGGGGGYTALPRVYVTLTPTCFGWTNFPFFFRKFKYPFTWGSRTCLASTTRVSLAGVTIFRAFHRILLWYELNTLRFLRDMKINRRVTEIVLKISHLPSNLLIAFWPNIHFSNNLSAADIISRHISRLKGLTY